MPVSLRRSLVVVAVVSASLASAADQAALVAPTLKLDPVVLQKFDLALPRARVDAATVFSSVRGVVAHADAFDAKRRGRFFPMTPLLRDVARAGQGHRGAVLAFLEPVVHPEHFAMPRSPSALISLRAGLLEASADFKDPLAAPVYRGIVQTGTGYYDVRAAAEALGTLGLEPDVAMLSKLATTPGPSQDAVISGLGSCRRLAAAVALTDLATTERDVKRATLVVGSLGRLASAWVLAIPHAVPANELQPLRHTAAVGALAVYLSAVEPSLRDAASDALMTIDAPESKALIEAARPGATEKQQAALDALSSRFDRNPTRGSR